MSIVSKQTKWDHRFIELAEVVAEWSKDPSTQVGCVITDDRNRVVSLGFNGLPRGIEDRSEVLGNREQKYRMVIHAEENACLFATRSLEGCTAYVWPMPPCPRCAGKLIQVGIRRIVSIEPTLDLVERWGLDLSVAYGMFEEVGVKVTLL